VRAIDFKDKENEKCWEAIEKIKGQLTSDKTSIIMVSFSLSLARALSLLRARPLSLAHSLVSLFPSLSPSVSSSTPLPWRACALYITPSHTHTFSHTQLLRKELGDTKKQYLTKREQQGTLNRASLPK
jgi:hypothetical protein